MTSLNPVLSIGRQLIEAIEAHTDLSRGEARQRAVEALKAVRIPDAESRLEQYPHELSGGMRQRVMIAMALALKPDVLIADEPTTALDVTVQGEVLELLRDLQREHGTGVILITHDMGVVAEMADRVIVMRHGRMVEEGRAADIFAQPQARLHARAAGRGAAHRRRRAAGWPARRASRRGPTRGRVGARPARPLRPRVAASSAASTGACTRSKASASRSRRTRRWRWSANPAAASRRPPRRSPGSCPTAATIAIAGRNLARPRPRRAQGGPPRRADDLPGPLRLARPAHDGRRPGRRAAADPRHRLAAASARDRVAALFERVGLSAEQMDALSARILRRPAPAHLHRPRAGAAAEADHRRRERLGARRLGAGARAGAAEGTAGRVRRRLSLHLARHGGGREHLRPRRRHVSRPDRRDGHARPGLLQPAPPLYPAADRGGAGARPQHRRARFARLDREIAERGAAASATRRKS